MAGKARISRELEALKALVMVYGPREAARLSGMKYGTVASYCFRYQWKKKNFKVPESIQQDALTGKDAADVMGEALERHKADSTINLARYVDKAAERAANHKDPLEVARKVRDVAGVYQVLYPPEEEAGLIEGAILIGQQKPTINLKELQAAKVKEVDVRTGLQDQGSAGD